MTLDIHVPAGSTGHDSLTVDISAADAGWTYSGLRVAVLEAGAALALETGDYELLVLPLAGSAAVEVGGRTYDLTGRPSVFEEITDFLYVPRRTAFTLHYRVCRGETLIAEAATEMVAFDYHAHKIIALPPAFAAALGETA